MVTEYLLKTNSEPSFPKGRFHQIIASSESDAINVLILLGYKVKDITVAGTNTFDTFYVKSWKA